LELYEEAKKFFEREGYRVVDGLNILKGCGKTFFVVAGVEILNDVLIKEKPIPHLSLFVAQPSVRLKFIDYVEENNGFSTSFVNLSTQEVNPSLKSHIKHVNNWVKFLHSIGLHSYLTFSVRERKRNWGFGEFDGIGIVSRYCGVEIGVCNFLYNIPQRTREFLRVSDIGFGLERLGWLINKPLSYFDVIGPILFSLRKKYVLMDSIRTMVLMASHGILEGKREQIKRFKRLAKKCEVDTARGLDIDQLISYYYNFWSKIRKPPKSKDYCKKVIRYEIYRHIIKRLSYELKTPPLKFVPSIQEYLEKTLKNGVSFDKIREVVTQLYMTY
jgi:hypothetical protein